MMENLIISINCVIPIFIIMLIGYIWKQTGRYSDEFFKKVNNFGFYALLSVNLFMNGYNSDLKAAFDIKLQLFNVIGTLVIFSISGIILKYTISDSRKRGAIWQTTYRTNIGIIGIILIENLATNIGISAMSVTLTILVPIFNILAVYSLEKCQGKHADFSGVLIGIIKNPLIIGGFAGLFVNIIGLKIPNAICKGLDNVSIAGTTLALITLGSTLDFSKIKGNFKILAFYSTLRLILIPALMITIAVVMGFRNDFLSVILITFATPLATNAFPMALVYDSDSELTSQFVLLQSVLCCLTLFLWIFVLKQFGLI